MLHLKDLPKPVTLARNNIFTDIVLPVRFCMRPLGEYPGELMLFYSYVLEDGGAFSTEPVPYMQAVKQ